MSTGSSSLTTKGGSGGGGVYSSIDTLFLTVFLGSGLALGLERLSATGWWIGTQSPFFRGNLLELLAFLFVLVSGTTSVLIIFQRKAQEQPVQFEEFALDVAIMSIYLAQFAFINTPALVLDLTVGNFALFIGWDLLRARRRVASGLVWTYFRGGRNQATIVGAASYLTLAVAYSSASGLLPLSLLLALAILLSVFYRVLKDVLERRPIGTWWQSQVTLLVIGNVTIDRLFEVDHVPTIGSTGTIKSQRVEYGGRGANIAVISARLGAEVDLGSVVGGDLPVSYIEDLKESGVGLRWVRTVGSAQTASFYEISEDSSRRAMLLSPIASAPSLGISDLALTYDAVFITPFDSDRHIRELAPILLKHPLVFLTLGEESERMDIVVIEKALGFSSYLLLNDSELQRLLEKINLRTSSELVSKFPNLEAVIVTKGSQGVSIIDESGDSTIPASHSASKSDLGAGDSFAAAFMVDMLRDGDVNEAVRLGQVVASLAIEEEAVQKYRPNWTEIRKRFIQTYGSPLRDWS